MKNLIRWLVGIVCGLFLFTQIAVHIPAVQRMLGTVTASALKDLFGWDVSVGRVRFGLWNRVIIDDLNLKDKQDSTMLHASRLAAKFNLLPLAKGQISIANVQLFGTQVNLYQSSPDSKPNFQFVIDTFSSNDTTSSNLDLRIGSILLRGVSVNWHQHWKPRKAPGTFDPAHLLIRDIAVTAHLKALTSDSLNLSLKRLSFNEESGISLKNLSFDLIAGNRGASLKNFSLQLPHSTLLIPSTGTVWPHFPRKGQRDSWLRDISVMASPSMSLIPSDLAALSPLLKHADTPLEMQANVFFSEGCVNIPSLSISDGKAVDLSAKVFVYDIINSPEYTLVIEHLHTNASILQNFGPAPPATVEKIRPFISRMDTVTLSGRLHVTGHKQDGAFLLANKHGNLSIKATAHDWNNINANLSSSGIAMNRILADDGNHDLGKIAFDITAKGEIKDSKGKPSLTIQATVPTLQWQERNYEDMGLHALLHGNTLEAKFTLDDGDGEIRSHMTWTRGKRHQLTGYVNANKCEAERLGLGKLYPTTLLSINTAIDLSGSSVDDIAGCVNIKDFAMQDLGENPTPAVGPIDISLSTTVDKSGYRTLDLSSPALNITANGHYRFSTLAATMKGGMHNKLPKLIRHENPSHKADSMHFSISLHDTVLIRNLAQRDIKVPQPATLKGDLYGYDSIRVRGEIPELHMGRELLRNGKIDIHGTHGAAKASISTERRHKKGFVAFSLKADAHDDRLRLIASMDNNRKPRIGGEMDITTTFMHDEEGELNARAWIAPTDFVVSDTIWKIHPCGITWDGQVADIRGFRVSQSAHRGIDINGRASASEDDTLRLNLNDINVEYILELVNFKSVEFHGRATGSVLATSLLSSPHADIDLTVERFAFNRAPLGTLHAKANWGDTPHFLSLDATISDPGNLHLSTIGGGFHLGSKHRRNGLDLRVNTQRFNLAFLNRFTKGILDDFQGRSSGYCRIYGPFKGISLQGEMLIDHADFTMPMLGTSYHLQNDSVHIRPDEISITALLSDKNAVPFTQPFASYAHTGKSTTPHTAVLQGRLTHRNFKNLHYDFHVNANKFLGYDFKEFGESSFYATCIVSGDIDVKGMPGRLSVNVNATPEQGTVFTYNVATPDALTDANFITIGSLDDDTVEVNPDNAGRTADASAQTRTTTSSDMYLDFDLPITTAAKIRLLMDRKSGDMIEINGNGRIRAKYYNKGRFNIYGTYHVQDGTYSLSLQEIIRKEFKFQPGGTIVFGGNAMKADLNLKALYSVNSVSLDDLTDNSLGFSKTRVDCIMNLTGHPEQPSITFDFDLPNATEDEKQMVRSVVSTEEERNMQAIYLLGLGRFYNSNSDGGTQSSAAMNSLVSSTLSSHLNNLISTAVGSRNWNVNAFLQTTEDGWSNMDVEGQLSGTLFDNRLLLTGNFGYREKYYTQRNFISDVSVEYLLTRNGMLSIKAYNKANDRYFVQSSLNTQGIGLQYKRDFNHLRDLFRWLRPRKKQESK